MSDYLHLPPCPPGEALSMSVTNFDKLSHFNIRDFQIKSAWAGISNIKGPTPSGEGNGFLGNRGKPIVGLVAPVLTYDFFAGRISVWTAHIKISLFFPAVI